MNLKKQIASVLACSMLLATAPAIGTAPNKPQNILAIPCPINSELESCRIPVRPSVTTQDNKDTIAIKIANVSALGSTASTNFKLNPGTVSFGKLLGSCPYTL